MLAQHGQVALNLLFYGVNNHCLERVGIEPLQGQ